MLCFKLIKQQGCRQIFRQKCFNGSQSLLLRHDFFFLTGKNNLFIPNSNVSNEESICTKILFAKKSSQRIKIPIGKKKRGAGERNERTYVFDFFPFFTQVISCKKTGNNAESLLEMSTFAHKSSQEISGTEQRLVPPGEPHRCKWEAPTQLLPPPPLLQTCNPRQRAVPPPNNMQNSTRAGWFIQVWHGSFRASRKKKNLCVNMQETKIWLSTIRDEVTAVPQDCKAIYFTGFKVIHAWVQEISSGISKSPVWVRTRFKKMIQWISSGVRFS